MKVIGLVCPITIRRPHGQMVPHLVAGAHRLSAAKKLGWELIPCVVAPPEDDDRAALMEIDENLMRGELSPAERAVHIDERKAIYERLHPQTQHGAVGRGGKKDPNLGSFSHDTAKATGRSKSSVAQDPTRAKKIPQIVELIGTSLDKGEELDALTKLSPERQEHLIAKAKAGEKVSAKPELKKVRREEREVQLAVKTEEASRTLGSKLYGVIYADPPWRFRPYGEAGMDRAADNHYPTMTVEEIRQLPVPAANDCVLFLWATVPMEWEAHEVLRAWGFEYRNQFVWLKDRVGTGYWCRNKHEILLIGTKGNPPAPAPGEQSASVLKAPIRRHSEKPTRFAEMIKKMFPNTPALEMFARQSRDGWECWGNEVSAFTAAETAPVLP